MMGLPNRLIRRLTAATALISLAVAIALSSRAAEPQYSVMRASAAAAPSTLPDFADHSLRPQPLPNAGDLLPQEAFPLPPKLIGVDLSKQTEAEAMAKSRGCIVCHEN